MELLLHGNLTGRLSRTSFAFGQTHIFFGQMGQGKSTAAIELARQANCTADAGDNCVSCLAFSSGTTPDLLRMAADGPSIGIDQIRLLQQKLSLAPARASSKRVVVMEEAELLTSEAQNAMLKLMEEPPPSTTLILITTNLEALLPTVRSRSQMLYFPPLDSPAIESWLGKMQLSPQVGAVMLAGGAPGLALTLAKDPKALERYQRIDTTADQLLSKPLFDRLIIIKDFDLAVENLNVLKYRLSVRSLEQSIEGRPSVLVAVERLWGNLRAGVTSRAALESLAMEV